MFPYFRDYYWSKGCPKGRDKLSDKLLLQEPLSYRIITDPYYKHITVEKYERGVFVSLVYDSNLLDFRRLKSADQLAWRSSVVSENEGQSTSLIRNQDDRVILLETYYFKAGKCRKCITTSPHRLKVSTQQMFYTELGDSFNGVKLLDADDHPVLVKTYGASPLGEFTTILTENWTPEELVAASKATHPLSALP